MTQNRASAAATPNVPEALRALLVPVRSVHLDPLNARKHDEKQIAELMRSLKSYGQRRPIVVNEETRHIEAGNGIYMAAIRLGWTQVAALIVKDDDAAATGYSLADNRLGDLSEFDEKTMNMLLSSVEWDQLPPGFLPDELSLPDADDPASVLVRDPVPVPVDGAAMPNVEIILSMSREQYARAKADIDAVIQKHQLDCFVRINE